MNRELEIAENLKASIHDATEQLNIDELSTKLDKLKKTSQEPDFWQDNLKAQAVMKEISQLETKVAPWVYLRVSISDLVSLCEIGDDNISDELVAQLEDLTIEFDKQKAALRFNDTYDSYDAIVSIHAGAGGTDAQDWAALLLRMYTRWAERHNMRVILVEESAGEEAGLKSVTFEVKGDNSYGLLKSEHGVHRLVRLSPYNAESRETSFAKVEVMPEIDKPDDVEIEEKDLKVDVYRSGGHGGQSVNTTDSAVRLTHLPTGLVVAIQNERSQLQNKETAMTILRSRLAQLQLEQHVEKVSELKGPSSANEFGSQIRNYIMHPYKQVKDLRTHYETSDIDGVLDGDLDGLIDAYLEYSMGTKTA